MIDRLTGCFNRLPFAGNLIVQTVGRTLKVNAHDIERASDSLDSEHEYEYRKIPFYVQGLEGPEGRRINLRSELHPAGEGRGLVTVGVSNPGSAELEEQQVIFEVFPRQEEGREIITIGFESDEVSFNQRGLKRLTFEEVQNLIKKNELIKQLAQRVNLSSKAVLEPLFGMQELVNRHSETKGFVKFELENAEFETHEDIEQIPPGAFIINEIDYQSLFDKDQEKRTSSRENFLQCLEEIKGELKEKDSKAREAIYPGRLKLFAAIGTRSIVLFAKILPME